MSQSFTTMWCSASRSRPACCYVILFCGNLRRVHAQTAATPLARYPRLHAQQSRVKQMKAKLPHTCRIESNVQVHKGGARRHLPSRRPHARRRINDRRRRAGRRGVQQPPAVPGARISHNRLGGGYNFRGPAAARAQAHAGRAACGVGCDGLHVCVQQQPPAALFNPPELIKLCNCALAGVGCDGLHVCIEQQPPAALFNAPVCFETCCEAHVSCPRLTTLRCMQALIVGLDTAQCRSIV